MRSPEDILREYLVSQGVGADDWNSIANPTEKLEHDPMKIKDSRLWLNTLYQHRHDVITVVGDYDADGILASATMADGLELLGVGTAVHRYVPTRMDGYGITAVSVEKIKAQFPDTQTIVTVDNGISAFEGVDSAKALGWTVLITDHHLAKETLPNADVIADINRAGDDYPFKGISGTTVAYKMIEAYARVLKPELLDDVQAMRLYVGVSAVGDMMPLRDENRFYVRYAMNEVQEYINGKRSASDNPQFANLIRVLLDQHAIWDKHVTSETFGFLLCPILNSPSRVTGSPELAYDYFSEKDTSKLYHIAEEMVAMNTARKSTIQTETGKALRQAKESMSKGMAYGSLVVTVNLTAGFVGLVAGNLTRDFSKPSIAFATKDFDGNELTGSDIIHGSARSPKGISIVEVLTQINKQDSTILKTFGGHAGAGGLAIPLNRLDDFRAMYDAIIVDMVAKGAVIDTSTQAIKIDVDDVSPQLVNAIEYMSPFGMEFPRPEFIIEDVTQDKTKEVVFMGAEKQHVKFSMAPNFDIIDWKGTDHYKAHEHDKLTCQGTLGFGREFRGNRPVQLIVDRWL